MDIILYFPPLVTSGVISAYPSLPVLAGYLKEHSSHNVVCVDVNVDFINRILAENTGRQSKTPVRLGSASVPRLLRLAGKCALEGGQSALSRFLYYRLRYSPDCSWLKLAYRDFERSNVLQRVEQTVLSGVSPMVGDSGAAYEKTREQAAESDPNRSDSHYILDRWQVKYAQILDIVRGVAADPTVSVLGRSYFPNSIANLSGRRILIGFSVAFLSQLGSALYLSKYLKEIRPEAFVVIGGNLIKIISNGLERIPEVFDVVDCFVDATLGEQTLLDIANHIAEGSEWRNIASIVYRDNEGRVSRTAAATFDLSSTGRPDYSWIGGHGYIQPHRLYVRASVGCYWNKCSFCTLAECKYSQRTVEAVASDMIALSCGDDPKLIGLVSNALPLTYLSRLADLLITRKAKVYWDCYTRFDGNFTGNRFDDAFCRKLIRAGCHGLGFGLESASQRINDLMNKGVSVEAAQRVLDTCRKHAFKVNVGGIVGFPGETEREMAETVAFFERNSCPSFRGSIHTFKLQRGSFVYDNPEKFGIMSVEDAEDYLLKESYQFHSESQVEHATAARIQRLYTPRC